MSDKETNEQEEVKIESGNEVEGSATNVEEEEGASGFSLGASIGIAVAVIGLVIAFFLTQTGGVTLTSSGSNNTSGGSNVGSEGEVFILPASLGQDSTVISVPWRNLHFAASLMHRGLFLAEGSLEVTEPDLAKSLKISEDSLTYTIEMQEGIKWSDGVDVTIDDVIFSFEWILLAELTNTIYSSAFANIDGASEYIENPSVGLAGVSADGNTLTIQLSNPYPALEQVLAQFTILPKHAVEGMDMVKINENISYWEDPIVCGMYKVGTADIGVDSGTITLVQNEYYEKTTPKIEEILLTSDTSIADCFSTNNVEDISLYRTMNQYEEYQIDILFYCYLFFNMGEVDSIKSEAMQDPLVRKAIGYAINREELLRTIYLNAGAIIDTGVPRSHSANVGEDVDMPYDPEKAKELLAESGYDTSQPLRFTYYNSDDASAQLVEGIKENLEAVGFTVELYKTEDISTFYVEGAYDIAYKRLSAFSLNEWYGEYDDDNINFKNLFGGTTGFEKYINVLLSEVDYEEVESILKDLQYLEDELYFKVPLFTLNHSVFVNTNRVSIPSDVVFLNTYYRHNIKFEEWTMK